MRRPVILPGFPQTLQEILVFYLTAGHVRFLLYLFQFTMNLQGWKRTQVVEEALLNNFDAI
jgi:hypothetical protein